jgi:hypothetical protein
MRLIEVIRITSPESSPTTCTLSAANRAASDCGSNVYTWSAFQRPYFDPFRTHKRTQARSGTILDVRWQFVPQWVSVTNPFQLSVGAGAGTLKKATIIKLNTIRMLIYPDHQGLSNRKSISSRCQMPRQKPANSKNNPDGRSLLDIGGQLRTLTPAKRPLSRDRSAPHLTPRSRSIVPVPASLSPDGSRYEW